MFLLVLAHLGSHGQNPESHKTVVVVDNKNDILLLGDFNWPNIDWTLRSSPNR